MSIPHRTSLVFSPASIAHWERMADAAKASQDAFISRFINPPPTLKGTTVNTQTKLPAYKSHKTVRAMKIGEIQQAPLAEIVEGGSWLLMPKETGLPFIQVPHSYMLKHSPEVGGYFVQYEDGYQSYSPAKAFEEGYTLVSGPIAVAAPSETVQSPSAVTDNMVSRFLGWKLPQDFSPDCGISFKRESDYDHPEYGRIQFAPIGTNLLNAIQARAMLEHILGSSAKPVETKTYPDGTTATGTAPLPDTSPTSDTGQAQGLTFGDALNFLKQGKKVARSGWNGKGMWLSLSGPLGGRVIYAKQFWSENNAQFAAEQPANMAVVLPCITMKTATGEILMGWLASQTDMLAEDWVIVS